MDSLQKRFDDLLLETIDEILTSLGEPVKNYLYTHLESDLGIKKEEIPEKIVGFSKMLHQIFGLGASRLETKFMERLYSKMKVNLECPECNWSKWIENDISFIKCINTMRESYIRSG